jgi:hypothetical protein
MEKKMERKQFAKDFAKHIRKFAVQIYKYRQEKNSHLFNFPDEYGINRHFRHFKNGEKPWHTMY